MMWATAMGLGGGLVMVSVLQRLAARLRPHASRPHSGRGAGDDRARLGVGPLLLAWCVEWTGSYGTMFQILAAVIGTTVAASITPLPAHRRSSDQLAGASDR